MHVRSSRRHALLSLATLVLLAACAGQQATAGDAGPSTPAAETTAPRWTGERLDDSTWSRVVTAADAKARDAWTPEMRADLGADRELTLSIQLLEGRFAVSGDFGDGVTEVGDLGTVDYDERGRMEWVSESGGCPGCRATIEWTLEGDTLRTRLVPGSAGRAFDPEERLVMEGTWTRAD